VRKFTILLLALSSVGLSQAQADFFQPKIKSANACGHVVDKTGQGIRKAVVVLTNAAGARFETNSDESGRFAFDQQGAGWELDVQATGFTRAHGQVTQLSQGSISRCRKPIYAVLDVGGLYTYSYLTTKRSEIRKLKNDRE
jgi:hypothetical protein